MNDSMGQQDAEQEPVQDPGHEQQAAAHESGAQPAGPQQAGTPRSGTQQPSPQQPGAQYGGPQQAGAQQPGASQQESWQAAGQQSAAQPAGPQHAGAQQPGMWQAGPQQAGAQQSGPQYGGAYQDSAPQQWQGGQPHGGPQYGGPQQAGPWHTPYGPAQYYPFGPQQPPRKHGRRRLLSAGALGLAAVVVAGSVAWGIDQRSGGNSSQLSQQQFDAAAVAAKVTPGLVDVNTVLGLEGARAAGTGIVLSSDGEVLTNHHVVEGATSITVNDKGNGKTYTAGVVGYDATHDIAVLKLNDASGLQTAKTGDSDQVKLGDQVVGIGNAGGVGGTPSFAAGQVTGLNQAITATDENGQDPENLTGLIQTNADIQAGDSGGPLANASGEVVGVDTAGSGGNNGGQGRPGQTAATTGSAASATLAASGDGSGNDNPGFGPGNGFGDGSGNGFGDGSGNGSGNGFGDGSGNGSGNGFGDGSGNGSGNGFGDGPGNGSGDGSGNGSGNGSGTTTEGYAIPINDALDIAQQIESGKATDTVHIGASALLGISVVATPGTTGAVVGDVVAEGNADDAGISAGDVITSFAGHAVDSPDALSSLLNNEHPGNKVEVGWVDQSGQSHKATIELITGPVR